VLDAIEYWRGSEERELGMSLFIRPVENILMAVVKALVRSRAHIRACSQSFEKGRFDSVGEGRVRLQAQSTHRANG
jgi:hypothetical protein